jgi:transcriptional regulator NrdR family protein
MSHLKTKNLNKCVSLLREFIENADSAAETKEIAALALDQLQNITAGNFLTFSCTYRPRIDGSPSGG